MLVPTSNFAFRTLISPMSAALPDPNILLIDDEPVNISLLQAILQRAGFRRVNGTSDPVKGLAMAAASEPDLILLDLNMPVLNGYEVLERLRTRQPPGSFLPILILTADANPGARQRALSGGATDFVTKPFDNAEVLQRCRNLLETRALHLALQSQNARLEETVRQRTHDLEQTLAELRASQQQRVEQERMRALGEMSSGIAADFYNQLTSLLGYSDLLLLNDAQMLSNKTLARRYLENIRTAAREASAVVGRLREFARLRTAGDVLLPVNLSKLVQETATLTQPRWRGQALAAGSTVAVRLDLEPTPDVVGHAAELREVVAHLIFNAVDAMPQGGTITIRTRQTGDGHASLEVADTGIGMSDEIRRRCLEPFFTTKDETGKGLGLSMVYGVVKRHEGELKIETTRGEGTCVSISLPVATNVRGTPPPAGWQQPGRPLRVLLVENDPLVRETVTDYLRRDEHEVSTAATGREGLNKFAEGTFDLVVTDLALEELNGEALAKAIREQDATVPIILLTGFVDSLLSPDHRFDAVLHKPLVPTELWQAIARVTTHPVPAEPQPAAS